jgi:cyanophycinase-like exopeptidase
MVRSHIHLIGGGPGTLGAFRRHMKAVLGASGLGKTKRARPPLVAYVGAASGDNAGFLAMIGAEIVRAGGRVKPVRLASPKAKRSTAQGVLEDCDAVLMSGGDVEAGMNVLHERGVLPLFDALAAAGRPIIGLSAGSIMLGRSWVRFHEEGDDAAPPALFACMGLAPVYVDAHAEEDRWAELRVVLRLVSAAGEPAPVGFGLTCKGGIRVEATPAGGAKIVPFGTAAPRFVVRGGRVVAVRPVRLGSSARVL